MKPGEIFEISVVGLLGVLVALIRIPIGKGSYKSEIFSVQRYMSPFLAISFSMVI